MKRIAILLMLMVAVNMLTACNNGNIPLGKMDVRGDITQITKSDSKGVLGIILVEGELQEDTKVDKASVTVTDKTKIFAEGNQEVLEDASFSLLQAGQLVEVEFTGPVRESYPVQATAKTIVIKSTQDKEPNIKGDSFNGVKLKLEKNVYNIGQIIKLTIVNESNSLISFGRPYLIEQYKEGQWSEYPLELAFTLEMIMLEQGKTFDQNVPLNEFETGKYRILKSIYIEEANSSFQLVNEFEIN